MQNDSMRSGPPYLPHTRRALQRRTVRIWLSKSEWHDIQLSAHDDAFVVARTLADEHNISEDQQAKLLRRIRRQQSAMLNEMQVHAASHSNVLMCSVINVTEPLCSLPRLAGCG